MTWNLETVNNVPAYAANRFAAEAFPEPRELESLKGEGRRGGFSGTVKLKGSGSVYSINRVGNAWVFTESNGKQGKPR
jgi:hypothetical protein